MGHPLRYHPPDSIFEVTHRTIDGALALRPCRELNERIEAIVARAQKLYGIEIFIYVFLANHYHMMARAKDLESRSAFLKHIHRNISLAAREINGGTGPLWAGRPKIRLVLDEAAALRRMRYIAENGVKEGLVETPVQWPGASAARALLRQRSTVTIWRTAKERHALAADESAGGEVNELRLSSLPSHARLSRSQRIRMFRALFADIAADARTKRNGRPPLGVRAILAQDPRTCVPLEPRGAPIAFASELDLLIACYVQFQGYAGWFRYASRRRRTTGVDVRFPPGSCPPSGPYVPHPAVRAQPAV